AKALEPSTRTALANLRYPLLAQAKLPPRAGVPTRPVPERVGEPSVFRHVLYIIKENCAYDEILGDVAVGNGDRELCVFGQRVTPNQHKLVREVALLDNTYCCGILSADGHEWATSAIATDYMERSFTGWPRGFPRRQQHRGARRAGLFPVRVHLGQCAGPRSNAARFLRIHAESHGMEESHP